MGSEHHSNWLDQWRLFFAALVIVSHSFDLLGHEADEPLRQVTGLGFGGVGVCGFFAISGYLITRSWTKCPDPVSYLRNRFLRIVPAFVVAFAISVLVVGPIIGGGPVAYLPRLNWPLLASDLLTLTQPHAPTIAPYPEVNGSLWTLRYEFLCYLLAPFAVQYRFVLGGLWFASLLAAVATDSPPLTWLVMFLSGAVYYRLDVRPGPGTLLISAILLPLSLLTPLWEVGLAIPGCLILLSTALRPRRSTGFPDSSYGTYLYGWPIQKLLIFAGVSSPWMLLGLAAPLALAAGMASWFAVERVALRLKQHQAVREAR